MAQNALQSSLPIGARLRGFNTKHLPCSSVLPGSTGKAQLVGSSLSLGLQASPTHTKKQLCTSQPPLVPSVILTTRRTPRLASVPEGLDVGNLLLCCPALCEPLAGLLLLPLPLSPPPAGSTAVMEQPLPQAFGYRTMQSLQAGAVFHSCINELSNLLLFVCCCNFFPK